MKENRSFDHLLGKLHDRGQPGVEAVPSTYSNPDARGNAVFPAHATTTCLQLESGASVGRDPPRHETAADGRLRPERRGDGRRRTARSSMSYYDATDLPFDYWLASNVRGQ